MVSRLGPYVGCAGPNFNAQVSGMVLEHLLKDWDLGADPFRAVSLVPILSPMAPFCGLGTCRKSVDRHEGIFNSLEGITQGGSSEGKSRRRMHRHISGGTTAGGVQAARQLT